MKFFFTFLLFISIVNAEQISAKDFLQREVKKPQKLERIVITCYGGAVHELALFVDEKKIVAHPGAQRFKFFEKIYPELAKTPSVGTFNDVNLETLLRVKPDIVFAGVTSLTANERIEALGIPVFTMGIGKQNLESLLKEFEEVGKLVGNEDKAHKLVTFWRKTLSEIQIKLSKTKKQVRVLYTNGSGKMSSQTKGWWGDTFVKLAGGINVAEDIKVKGDISTEMLLNFNPDVLILSNNLSLQVTPQSVKENPLYKSINAVKNNNVYVAPVGGFWWDRPSPEAILGILWLSKTLYPKETKDIDLFVKTQTFFKEFYNYELTEKEFQSFF